MKNTAYCFILISLYAATACTKDKSTEQLTIENTQTICDSINISFSNDILPIFQTSCSTSNCHSSSNDAGGYTLESHTQISDNAIISQSVMNHVNGVSPMPKFQSQLPDSILQKFDCWISKGKLNN